MTLKVAILDMQPIAPAVGGGRLRLLGLYHALGEDVEAHYVGTFDWPGEAYRRIRLSAGLEEVDVPLSDAHHAAARKLSERASGKTVIDVAFHRQGHLSPDYLAAAGNAVKWADVVVFSHPWVYPLMRSYLHTGQTVVYDSHNVEGILRAQLFREDVPIERNLLCGVVEAERGAGGGARAILACSQEDIDMFHRIYGWPLERMYLVPNGVMAESIKPATVAERESARLTLQIPTNTRVAIFIGSDYPPNIEAARFLAEEVAPAVPEVTFVIAGGVGAQLGQVPTNVVRTGLIDDTTKVECFRASDFAVNPMFSGSGTNIKMFDFMAAGLPIVATAVGARGVAESSTDSLRIVRRDDFVSAVANLARLGDEARSLGLANREIAERGFSWEKISPALGRMLHLWSRSPPPQTSSSKAKTIRVAHLGTLGLKCGIGEYTRCLIKGMRADGVANYLLACRTPTEAPSLAELDVDGSIGWFYDNQMWRDSYIETDAVSLIRAWGADVLLIQYHPGFFNAYHLHKLATEARSFGISVGVVLHNFHLSNSEILRDLAAFGVRLLSHRTTEISAASALGVTLEYLPFGVDVPGDMRMRNIDQRDWREKPPVIVITGFLRQHKGTRTLIAALHLLQHYFPGAKLIIQSALYPSDDSRIELADCQQDIARLGLGKYVNLDTRFLPIEQVHALIAQADLAVLPYDKSNEGGSASLATCLAAGLPVVVSGAAIFDDLRSAVCTVEPTTAEAIAECVSGLLSDPSRYQALVTKSVDYAKRNSWSVAACRIREVLAPQVDLSPCALADRPKRAEIKQLAASSAAV